MFIAPRPRRSLRPYDAPLAAGLRMARSAGRSPPRSNWGCNQPYEPADGHAKAVRSNARKDSRPLFSPALNSLLSQFTGRATINGDEERIAMPQAEAAQLHDLADRLIRQALQQ